MKVLIILTGGTIQSSELNGYLSPSGTTALADMYMKKYGNTVCFDTLSPFTILSENVDCSHYPKLVKIVSEALHKNYDGIIMTHGSDTLQYCASVLSYTLGNMRIPLMLVASNYILSDARANGFDNFCAAVDFIKNQYGAGVYVPYRNSDGKCYIHRGNLTMPHNMYSDDILSLSDMFYGKYEDGKWEFNDFFHIENEDKHYMIADSCSEESQVLWISAHPGENYSFSLDGIKSVLISSYHSGTMCTSSKRLKSFAAKAAERGIPIYLVGNENVLQYDSCREYEKLGIHVLRKASPIAMYIRLWLENTGNSHFDIEEAVAGDYL